VSYGPLAERYARAIFELGVESGQLDRLTEQIGSLANAYAESAELRSVLDNPLVPAEKREAILKELTQRLGLSELATNAVRLIAARRRLRALPEIAKKLGTLSDKKAGVVRVSVTSAIALDERQYQALNSELEKALSRKIVLERKQDASLIGGIVTRVGDNTIDGSLKGRLSEIQRRLLAG
jgi:F-type H+-transporting ATPase subunit delta